MVEYRSKPTVPSAGGYGVTVRNQEDGEMSQNRFPGDPDSHYVNYNRDAELRQRAADAETERLLRHREIEIADWAKAHYGSRFLGVVRRYPEGTQIHHGKVDWMNAPKSEFFIKLVAAPFGTKRRKVQVPPGVLLQGTLSSGWYYLLPYKP
jgi:hypothetical protein